MNEVIKLAAAIVVLRKLAQTSQQPNPAAPQFAGSQGGRVGIGPQQPLPVAPEVQLDPVLPFKNIKLKPARTAPMVPKTAKPNALRALLSYLS